MLDSPGKNEVCDLCGEECPAVSGLTVLQLDGGARGSVQIVSCGCLLSQVVQFFCARS